MQSGFLVEIAKYLFYKVKLPYVKIKMHNFYKMSEEELKDYDGKLYFERQGKILNWNNLRTYTEKMQWEKLFDTDERKVYCSDKYKVRAFVRNRIGEQYLIPLIGVWSNYREIDFSNLPEQFVIKTNHGSGDAIVVRNKSELSLQSKIHMRRVIESSLHTDYSIGFCELHYGKITPKIIAEEFIDSGSGDLQDYKFICFDGIPYFCWVDVGRFTDHRRVVFDMEWKKQNWNQHNYRAPEKEVPKPKNFDQMVDIVRKLADGFSHVRVDLYNVKGKIYFGEMTFTNGSGFEKIVPESADIMLGDLWNLDMTK